MIHCKGLCNPCSICECHLLQKPIMHQDVELQCNKSDMWAPNTGPGDCNQLLGHTEKVIHMKLIAFFKTFRFSSLLFELSLLLCVTKEEDPKKHLLFWKHLTECTCTQQTLTNVSHHYNDCKLLRDFPGLQSDKCCLRVFFSQIHVSFSSCLMDCTQL